MFNFVVNTNVFFGPGCRMQAAEIAAREGWKNIGVVVDANIRSVPKVADIIDGLGKAGIGVTVGECAISEPTYESLDAARKAFEGKQLDAFVGIGGGSALDMAKAMAVFANNHEPAITYRGFNKMTNPVLPIVAVPTTAGTGSEVTPNASFIDGIGKKKMGINGEAVRPRYALLDPELTLTCPWTASLSAGADSMVHAVEAYVAHKSNPMAKLFARDGFAKVFKNLAKVKGEPQNIGFREEVMLGAFLSGIALMNSGTGPAAAMSYPLGVHHKVPHGIGGAVFLPHIIRHNVNKGFCGYAGLYDALEGADLRLDDAAKSKRFCDMMFEKWGELGVPDNVRALGVAPHHVETFVADTMELKGALDQNPIPYGEEDIRQVLKTLGVE